MSKMLDIKETQRVSLDILKTITDICENQGFRYYLIYGTLIGAVRHSDFIPWDDDVDIMMPRSDYELFLQYMKSQEVNYEHLRVFNKETCSKYPYMITRISDDRYRIDMENEKDYGMGIFVDIYPYDGLGKSKEEAIKFGMKGDRLSSLCYLATRERCAVETTTSYFRKIVKFPVFIFSKICGKDVFQEKLQKLAGIKSYDECNYVGCIVWLSGGEKDIFKREWFDEYVYMPFGKYKFRVPKEYDKILTHIYGDYMELPPEKDRIGHHYYKVFTR